MKHCKLVENLSNLNGKPPLHERKAPPHKYKAPYCRLSGNGSESTLTASCIWWIVPIVTCESGERICGCSCL